jgi:hypothetical protein
LQLAILHAGQTRTLAAAFELNTGSSRSVRDKPQHSTWWDIARTLPLFPSFGVNTTKCRSITSAMPKIEIKLQLKMTFRAGIAFYDPNVTDAHWQ